MTSRSLTMLVLATGMMMVGWTMRHDEPKFALMEVADQTQLVGGSGGGVCTPAAATCATCAANVCAVNAAGNGCTTTGGSEGCGTALPQDVCVGFFGTCYSYYGGFTCGGPQMPSPCIPNAFGMGPPPIMAMIITGCAAGPCVASTNYTMCSNCR